MQKSKLQLKTKNLIKQALAEDVGSGDITTNAIVPADQKANAIIMVKENGVIAGLDVAKEVFLTIDKRISFISKIKDGAGVKKGQIVAELSGPARGILTGERAALNFLQHLSGIATLTDKFVLQAGRVTILDTRKTIPGLRMLEKYAVKMGGGQNHRMGLFDAVLIKDNHIEIARGVERAVEGIRRAYKGKKPLEVEAKTMAEVREAIKGKADRILLDNMSVKTLRQAIKLCKKAKIKTEASGGVNLENIRAIAKTGVDYVSIGALTHSAKALDISLKIISIKE